MIAIIQGCGTNIASIEFALERLGKKAILTADKKIITDSDYVILPGVNTAKQAMLSLKKLDLVETIRELKQPVLGICSGMQILFDHSEEGDINCLGIFPQRIKSFSADIKLPIPHMGWNQLDIILSKSLLLENIENNAYVYFVHSYNAVVNDFTIAETIYGNTFSAIVQKNNFYGVQFHPEKSGRVGELLLKNFLNLK